MHPPRTIREYMELQPSISITYGTFITLMSTPGVVVVFIIRPYDLSGFPPWLFVMLPIGFGLLFVLGVTMIFWGLRNAAYPGSVLYRLTRLRLPR
jgi:putative Mn2+ efflux pump MntP